MKRILLLFLLIYSISSVAQQEKFYKEKFRPQFHFTPPVHWMNDPNGLVFHKGEYHLFYQYNPFGIRWGHMSWGHAVSKDLVHWQHLPLAIPEEKDTMIFSGTCVVDSFNSAGFAKEPEQAPMVAVYTAHMKEAGQSQHIAYSLDDGRTWIKYNNNPVLDVGSTDFRDPQVFWHDQHKKWVMCVVLALEKKIQFYSSSDLKEWKWMSDFGPAGDTTGIWECPDLFQIPVQGEPGKNKWVLMHSPAPYMQYFVGEFDGTSFKNENPATKTFRPDYGPDYYAAITYKNLPAGSAPVSIGWVNNWNYAQDIPTTPWRSAMSLPRKLSVKKINNEWILIQQPAMKTNYEKRLLYKDFKIGVKDIARLPVRSQQFKAEAEIGIDKGATAGLRIAVSGDHYLEIGYDTKKNLLYLDRSKIPTPVFNPHFDSLARFETPYTLVDGKLNLEVYFDKSIVEVFVGNGERVFTAQIFPGENNSGIEFFTANGFMGITYCYVYEINSVWR